MIELFEHRPARETLAESETPAGRFIPYASHYNAETLLTKNGQMIQIIRLEGYAFESADLDEIDLKKRLRNVLLKSVAGPDYALWFHTVRKRRPTYPQGDFAPGFADLLNKRWKAKNTSKQLFQNELYISIVKRGQLAQVAKLQKLTDLFTSHANAKVSQTALSAQCRDLTEITRRFMTSLSDYGPHLLTVVPTSTGARSELLAFLGRLINLEDRAVTVPTMDLSRFLSWKRLFMGENAIECRGATERRFAAVVSIKEYSAETYAGMLDRFYALPFELVITQSFAFTHRHQALAVMQQQQRRMEQTHDLAVSQTDDIDMALDQAMGGAVAFGEHHLTVLPVADSLEELKEALARIETELMNVGVIGVREDINMEAGFWAQLPGNFEFIARRAVLSTANLAAFASLHNFPSGRPGGNHWGPAVTILETLSGTPYFFNFHLGDVGHTTLIGPTGCGKTALLNFLCAQSFKFGGRLFYFDRDRGSEIFIRALGGRYARLESGQPARFNPLRLPDTASNRAFLGDWLAALVTSGGHLLSEEDRSRIADAVSGVFQLAPGSRTLANLAPFLGMEGPERLASRLRPWYCEGKNAHLFGGAEDTLSLDGSVMGFELGEILTDPATVAPVLLYLFHRIQAALDGTPTIIVLEEAWALLQNPLFAARIESWLKTFRKLNAIVLFSTQSVEDAIRSSISPALIGQTSTHIYFPNPKATDEYKTVFKLSDRELELIREGLDRENRYFLLKRGRDAVVARADLSEMPEILSVLSGRVQTVRRLDQIREQVGDRPEAWLPIFMEAAHESR